MSLPESTESPCRSRRRRIRRPTLARPLLRCLLLTVLAGAGCQSIPSLSAYRWLDAGQDRSASSPDTALTAEGCERLKTELRPGDIILGAKNSPTALLIRLAMDEYSYHTHSGIVDVRDGDVVVSHATGRFQLFRRSPHLLGKVAGTVEAIPLETFIAEYDHIEIVRLPDAKKNARLAVLARAREQQHIPFDPFFDTLDPTAMHCSEYTLRTLRDAGYEDGFELVRRTPNRSFSDLLAKIGVTTDAFVRVDCFAELPGTRTVAVVSRVGGMAVNLAIADALHVLHDVVTRDPTLRVGDLVSCDSGRLIHFAPPSELFVRAAIGLAQASPTRDQSEIRRRSLDLYDVISRPHVQTLATDGSQRTPE